MTVQTQLDTKITYGFWGFIFGAGAAMLIGFVWGGWTTSSTTLKMSEQAVLASEAAICVAQFKAAPGYASALKELQDADSYNRSSLIEKGGWDKMPGQETAAWGVSSACATRLEADMKTGA